MKEVKLGYNTTFSYMKAIGIIAVVIGHCGAPDIVHDFIYIFHMPLFFLIAGYFFKETYTDDIFEFIKKNHIDYISHSLYSTL